MIFYLTKNRCLDEQRCFFPPLVLPRSGSVGLISGCPNGQPPQSNFNLWIIKKLSRNFKKKSKERQGQALSLHTTRKNKNPLF
jgi:hypothetical protein